jgi:hypothetical protein
VGGALRVALDRAEPFAAVVEMPSGAARGGRVRAAVEQVRLVRQLRPGLAQRCRGLAFVVTAQALDEHAKVIKSGPKIWGCSVTVATDMHQARVWARDQLTTGDRWC